MTLTHSQERVPAAERIAVRCVDSDVHPVPRRGELVQYIPEPWRSKYFGSRDVGEQIYYDAPDYAHAYAMRTRSKNASPTNPSPFRSVTRPMRPLQRYRRSLHSCGCCRFARSTSKCCAANRPGWLFRIIESKPCLNVRGRGASRKVGSARVPRAMNMT